MQTQKIKFGEQIDKSTGEIMNKEFQACIYVPEGDDTPYKPNVCLNLKLGDNSFSIYGDSIDESYNAIEQLYNWLHKIKFQGSINEVTIKSQNRYYEKKKLEAENYTKSKDSVPVT